MMMFRTRGHSSVDVGALSLSNVRVGGKIDKFRDVFKNL